MRYIQPEDGQQKTSFPWVWLAAGLAVAAVGYLAMTALATAAAGLSFADEKSPVMYFYSDACYACKAQKPILEQLAAEGFRVKAMDLIAHPEYRTQYGVQATPTFQAADGERLIGLTQKDELRAWLEARGARTGA